MATETIFGQLFVKDTDVDTLRSLIDTIYRADGYVPFEPSKVPKGYPAVRGEFRQVALGKDGHTGVCEVLLREHKLVFEAALVLSREANELTVLAVLSDPVYGERWKAYRAGQVVLKVGEDADDELLYEVEESEPEVILEFARGWGVESVDEEAIDDPATILSLPHRPVAFKDAVGGDWPHPLEVCLYVSRRSRLYMES